MLITEYDHHHKGMTEERQGAYLRCFLKLCFAHPAVEGFYVWGFWDGKHWRKHCGLWREDWSIKPNGQAWADLVNGAWRTRGEAAAADGRVTFRGFKGTYRLTWEGGAATVVVTDDEPVAAEAAND